ncbi:hypothetical protein SCHPADRAFT_901964 [Schizopora paradoxa]|uniref:Uncharacterized protein n=1 Tax=Schizopora paradoxa TaxID=27342 RepID=A0A0H2RUY9_9AGAM|nr:hypothetical protein SCHPADRAFT_901964 [Schizopora paradoxa]
MSSGDTNILQVPPELLAIVFHHALQNLPVQERSLQALTCSHVCRSFRIAALDSPMLWTSLPVRGREGKGHVKLAFIEACIERSGDLPLDAILQFYYHREITSTSNFDLAIGVHARVPMDIWVDTIFETTILHCARWRSCSWHFDFLVEGRRSEKYRPFSEVLEGFGRISAPLLEDLSIGAVPGMTLGVLPVLLRTHFSWTIPNIRAFTIENTLSVPSSAYRDQLRSVTANFHNIGLTHQISGLRSRLKILKLLSTVRLSFVDCCFEKASFVLFVEMPTVKNLEIALLGCVQTCPRTNLLWHEFRTFCFPNLAELHISLDIEDRDNLVLWNGHNIALYSILAPTLAQDHGYRYPSLDTLVVTIQSRTKSLTSQNKQAPLPTLILPCCCVPSLKRLHIRSTQHWMLLDGVGEFDQSQPPYFERGGQVVAINLKTVTFDVPHVVAVMPWVKRLASKMQDTDCWTGFSELTIIESGKQVVIPRDEVECWCDGTL